MPIIAAKARSPEPVTNKMIIQIGLSVGHHKNLPDSAPCWAEWAAAAGRSYQLQSSSGFASVVHWISVDR
jgi:hypothetical protein